MKDEVYFSVDIEASGPIPGQYSMLSVGACIVGRPNNFYYAELKPLNNNFISGALEISGFNLEELAVTGIEPGTVMTNFANWVTQNSRDGEPVFVGFNASFDWSFVNWYFHKFTGDNPFGFAALDIKAYYMGFRGCLWGETSSSGLPDGLRPSEPATHNALDDARSQSEIFLKIRSLQSSNKKGRFDL